MEGNPVEDPGCRAGLLDPCERPAPRACARHEWRMAALRLVRWAESHGRSTGGLRTTVVDERLELVLGARGCRAPLAGLEVRAGVRLADAISLLVAGVHAPHRGPDDPDAVARVVELGGHDALAAAARRTLLAVWREQPRQSW